MSLPPKKLTGSDIVLFFIVIAVGILMLLPKNAENGSYFIVTHDGVTESYSLSRDGEFELTSCGYSYIIKISDCHVSVSYSDCPDGICVGTGEISRCGDSIVCVPGKLVLTVGGERDEDYVVG